MDDERGRKERERREKKEVRGLATFSLKKALANFN